MAKSSKRGRKTPPPARRMMRARPKAAASRKAGDAGLKQQLVEARAQQAATAAILKIIARSPSDVQPVFEAILRSAVRLCGAEIAAVFPYDGKLVHIGATHNWSAEALRYFSGVYPSPPSPKLLSGRTILGKSIVKLADAATDEHYDPNSAATGHWRRMLGVPMLREGQPLGALVVCWRDPGETPQRQVDLLQTFADQAVIAIENVRLIRETQAALERQTATAEILRVISGSPTDTQPVFDAILERATKLCDAHTGLLFRYDDGAFHALATRIPDPEFAAKFKQARRPAPGSKTGLGRLISERRTVHIPDSMDDPAYREGDPIRMESVKGGMRSWLGVPLLKDGEMTGAIVIYRSEPRPFSDEQIALLQTFADQAVIGIENVRLFNETRKALERQTATAEILKVIASSPSDVQPVFDAIAQSACRLLGGFSSAVARVFDGVLQLVAFTNTDEAGNEAMRGAFPMPVAKSKAARTGLPVCVGDTEALPDSAAALRDLARVRGFRGIVIVPMLREGVATGTISVTRKEPGEFTDHQVELLKTFADQAVIAIENVRLFNETKEALERQTAISEILRVISGSPTDVRPVLDAVAARAARICDAADARIFLAEGDRTRYAAGFGDVPMPVQLGETLPLDRETVSGRAIVDRAPVHVEDMLAVAAGEYALGQALQKRTGFRTILAVPLMRESEALGAILLRRKEVRPFDGEQIALLKTFADQASIAIENVRLFNETKEALERQTATAEILKVIASSPTDTQPVFDAIAITGARLLRGRDVAILLRRDSQVVVAGYSRPEKDRLPEQVRVIPLDRKKNFPSQVILDGKVLHIPDWESGDNLKFSGDILEFERDVAKAYGVKACLQVPLLRKGEGIGAIVVSRATPGPFADKDIALVQSFADQAVIAIENVRLFNETKEALERQTATGEILKVIASSPSDVQPVFDAITQCAARLFAPCTAGILMREGEHLFWRGASGPANVDPDAASEFKSYPFDPASSLVSQAIASCQVKQIMDSEASYASDVMKSAGRAVGFRSLTAAPLLR
ncbi:MAG TPA: GAF domain-containing protein, partial [Burkholderiales bacterium]|nr:GAF domain-containing protein [Burkholderiales bacterium]